MQHAFAALIAATLLIQPVRAEETKLRAAHPYVGLWVTQDRHVRHELLPNGRYVEARGTRERAYEGRYEVTGKHIEYWDDTGFTADIWRSSLCSSCGGAAVVNPAVGRLRHLVLIREF